MAFLAFVIGYVYKQQIKPICAIVIMRLKHIKLYMYLPIDDITSALEGTGGVDLDVRERQFLVGHDVKFKRPEHAVGEEDRAKL